MFDYEVKHHIQKYILGVLYRRKIARFSELRKKGVDTNLFTYHLKLLQKNNFIEKVDGGYTLTKNGLFFVDRMSESNLNVRLQPKIITMLLLQTSDGKILLTKRDKQPFIDLWTLPHGKIHIEDNSVELAAVREMHEKLGLKSIKLKHAGDCYIRIHSEGVDVASTLAHVFMGVSDEIEGISKSALVSPRNLSKYTLAPAIDQVIARSFFGDDYFFEEFETNS